MMRWIVLSSLKLRFLMIALAGVLMVTGFQHLRDLPIDIVPEFSPLSIVVQTEAVGLSPSEVE